MGLRGFLLKPSGFRCFFFAKALALDCLPQGKTTAEAFGLWGVAGGKRPSRWWLQIYFYFHPYWGKISNLTNVFQMGLKPPTSHVFWSGYHGKCEKKTTKTLDFQSSPSQSSGRRFFGCFFRKPWDNPPHSTMQWKGTSFFSIILRWPKHVKKKKMVDDL